MKINREKINPRQAALHNAIKALLDSKSEELQAVLSELLLITTTRIVKIGEKKKNKPMC
jgi:hypothetical protein